MKIAPIDMPLPSGYVSISNRIEIENDILERFNLPPITKAYLKMHTDILRQLPQSICCYSDLKSVPDNIMESYSKKLLFNTTEELIETVSSMAKASTTVFLIPYSPIGMLDDPLLSSITLISERVNAHVVIYKSLKTEEYRHSQLESIGID